jgi:excinuclease UvrABC nuclease subunit
MTNAINWQSPNGQNLEFGIYQYLGQWNPVAGVYMFCRQELNGSYTPLYIGQAQSFQDRLSRHEQWNPAVQKGASVVLAAVVPLQANRDLFERQLIQQYQPPLNQQLRGGLASLLR